MKPELDEAHGTSGPSFETVYNWVYTISFNVAVHPLHSRRPVEAATSEIIEKVHEMFLNDR